MRFWKLRYVGSLDQVELDLPDGGPTVRVRRGELVALPADLARELLKQADSWTNAGRLDSEPEPERGTGLSPAEIARRSLQPLRNQRGLTQQQLADRMGEIGYPFGPAQLSKIESGGRGLSLNDTLALACALNVSPTHLLDGTYAGQPGEIAITGRIAVTPRRFRQWLRSQAPIPGGRRWVRSGEPRPIAFRKAVSDEDWHAMQHVTLTRAIDAGRRIVDAANALPTPASPESRHALADAIDEFNQRLTELNTSQSDYPSQRPTRTEPRGRPRRT